MNRPRTSTIALLAVLFTAGSGFGYLLGLRNASIIKVEVEKPGLSGVITFGAISTYPDDARYMNPAMEIALEEVNEYAKKHGLNVTFELRFESADFSDQIALQKFRSLEQSGVKVVLGMWWSSQLEACRSYANERCVVVISSASTAPSLAIRDDYVFRIVPTDISQARALARMMISRGIKAAVILQEDNNWGDGLGGNFVGRFEELGGIVIDRIVYTPYQAPSPDAITRAAESVKAAIERYGQEKVAVEAVSMGEIEAILRMAEVYPPLLNVTWFGSDGYVRWVPMIERMPDVSLRTRPYSPLTAITESSKLDAFAEKFYARTGLRLRHYEPESYDSVWIAALAVIQAGSYDADALRIVLPDICASYFGASGWLKLDENGDKATGDYDIWGVTEEGGVVDWRNVGKYMSAQDKVLWNQELN